MSDPGTDGPDRHLAISLNDHLGGATAGVDLAEHMAKTETGARAAELSHLAREIREDREALLALMAALEVPVRRYKIATGWLAEKAGRLKLNGRLLTRSPMSTLREVEMLRAGGQGKLAGWQALGVHATAHQLYSNQLDQLIARANDQLQKLEELRREAAADAFVASTPQPRPG